MTTSESINELATALAKAQAKMEGASKDGVNPHFKSKFATLASVWEAAREPLAANGLSVMQSASAEGPRVSITTLLAHSSGQWVRDTLTMTAQQDTPQGIGSAISYGRRYQLAAIVGVSPEDDDAEAAQGRPRVATVAAAPVAPPRGFDDWLIDLESTVEEGLPALEKAWKASKQEYRDCLIGKPKWEAMKAAAVKVTEKKAKAVTTTELVSR